MTTYSYRVFGAGDQCGVEAVMSNGRDAGVLYDEMFSENEAARIVRCLNHDDRLRWDEIEDYVSGLTDVLPTHTEATQ